MSKKGKNFRVFEQVVGSRRERVEVEWQALSARRTRPSLPHESQGESEGKVEKAEPSAGSGGTGRRGE